MWQLHAFNLTRDPNILSARRSFVHILLHWLHLGISVRSLDLRLLWQYSPTYFSLAHVTVQNETEPAWHRLSLNSQALPVRIHFLKEILKIQKHLNKSNSLYKCKTEQQ